MFAVLQLDCSKPELLWPKIGKMHNARAWVLGSANVAAPDKRNAPTTADPVLRSGNRQGAAGLPCRAGFLEDLEENPRRENDGGIAPLTKGVKDWALMAARAGCGGGGKAGHEVRRSQRGTAVESHP